MNTDFYCYQVTALRVIDGDTVEATLDLGFQLLWRQVLRLHGINAPEVRGPEREAGLAARNFLTGLLAGQEVVAETIKDRQGKYGRYLAILWLRQGDAWKNVNLLLVEAGHAQLAVYGISDEHCD